MSDFQQPGAEAKFRLEILQMLDRKLDQWSLTDSFIVSYGQLITVAWCGLDTIHRQLRIVLAPIKDLSYVIPFVGVSGLAYQYDPQGHVAWMRVLGESMVLRLTTEGLEEIVDQLMTDLLEVGGDWIDA